MLQAYSARIFVGSKIVRPRMHHDDSNASIYLALNKLESKFARPKFSNNEIELRN